MYFLDTLILSIFAIAFSSLGQASQVAEKCLVSRFAVPHIHIWKEKKKRPSDLRQQKIYFKTNQRMKKKKKKKQQGCQSKALLSPENINCSVDEISPCSCAWTPMRDINFCCLVNSCLLSPDGTRFSLSLVIYQ